jgi:hypothetical protein
MPFHEGKNTPFHVMFEFGGGGCTEAETNVNIGLPCIMFVGSFGQLCLVLTDVPTSTEHDK